MNSNLPLTVLLELAEKINSLEEKLSEILTAMNSSMTQTIKNTADIQDLKEDIIGEFVEVFKAIDEKKRNHSKKDKHEQT